MSTKHKFIIPTAAAAIAATAVCGFAIPSASPSATEPAPVKDTLMITSLAAGEIRTLYVPAAPDSADASRNPFTKDKLLDALAPLSPLKASAEMSGYEILNIPSGSSHADNKPEDEETLYMRRFLTEIRPESFFKGDLVVKTPAMMKTYLNGKEIMSKTQADSIAKETKASLTIEPSRDAVLEFHILSSDPESVPEIFIVPDKDSQKGNLLQGPELKSLYNIYTIVSGARIEKVRLSPDGNYILVKSTFCEDGIHSDSNYDVIDRHSGRTVAENIASDAEWLPSKDASLYFFESSIRSEGSLIVLDIPTMNRTVMAANIPDGAVGGQLSPDNSFLVYYTKVDGKKDEGIMRRLLSPDDRMPSNRNSNYLSIYRFADKICQPLTSGGPSTYLLDISPDSKKILYSSTRETPERFPFYEATLVELDLHTLRTDTIRDIDSSFTEAVYSPGGKQLMIAAGPNAFNGKGLNSGNFEWGNDFDMQLYLADLAKGGELKNIRPMTRDFNPSVMAGLDWNPTDGNLYFKAQKGYDTRLYRLNPGKGEIIEIPAEVDYITSWSVSRNRPEQIAYAGMGYNYMGRAYTLNLRSGKSSLLADPNAEYLSRVKTGKSDMWSFTCPAEAYSKPDSLAMLPTVVECTVTLPPDFDPAKKYPMIVYYYGGTTPTTHTNHSPYTPNLFSSRGYVTLTLNPSGTTGYGQEFSARHVNAWGDRTADEIIYGVRKFCEEHPYVDSDKIGCIGASYGGFMTQLLQTKTDLFAAAVSHAGISNITSYWGEGFWGYSYNSVAAARSYPWNNPALFTQNSPLFAADKIHTPLLLLHGNRDTNVPIGESIQLYNALKLLGREVEFITVDGSDHIVIDFQQRKEWHATIMAWFERWLKDDPRWWNDIYGK